MFLYDITSYKRDYSFLANSMFFMGLVSYSLLLLITLMVLAILARTKFCLFLQQTKLEDIATTMNVTQVYIYPAALGIISNLYFMFCVK